MFSRMKRRGDAVCATARLRSARTIFGTSTPNNVTSGDRWRTVFSLALFDWSPPLRRLISRPLTLRDESTTSSSALPFASISHQGTLCSGRAEADLGRSHGVPGIRGERARLHVIRHCSQVGTLRTLRDSAARRGLSQRICHAPSRKGGILFVVLPLCGIASMADPVLRSAITSHVSPDEQGPYRRAIQLFSTEMPCHMVTPTRAVPHKGGLASLVTVGGTIGTAAGGGTFVLRYHWRGGQLSAAYP